jgi:twitching motility protein PilT
MELDHLLRYIVEKGASDLHLKNGSPPIMRLHGELVPVAENIPVIQSNVLESMAVKILDERQRHHFEEEKEIDTSYAISGIGRFRVNLFRQRGSVSMVIRAIAHEVPSTRQLGLPDVINKIAAFERGLILVTGVTGSGKSTTMASMISVINRNFNKHIITIEDPIEFLIRDQKSIITQRELGTDTTSFSKALRAALRQDPDVILIGEMRDKDTIETALMAAETGHLVISTLHTKDAKETIHRILSFFPSDTHAHIRNLLANNLKSIVSLRLAKRKNKEGFVPAVEILLNNARVASMIIDPDETNRIVDAIEENSVSTGMQSFDQHLIELVKTEMISKEEALRLTNHQEDLELRMKGLTPKGEKEWQDFHESDEGHTGIWDDLPDLELDLDSDSESGKLEKAGKADKNKVSGFGFRRKKS